MPEKLTIRVSDCSRKGVAAIASQAEPHGAGLAFVQTLLGALIGGFAVVLIGGGGWHSDSGSIVYPSAPPATFAPAMCPPASPVVIYAAMMVTETYTPRPTPAASWTPRATYPPTATSTETATPTMTPVATAGAG